ncbi:MAG: hypothetical protein LBJ89_04695 [Holosporales bacterium]|jgi:hypothetical protein|nr:hypothetical protein [Holosporales bacterium]
MIETTANALEIRCTSTTRAPEILIASTEEVFDTSKRLISNLTSLFEDFERELTILRIKDDVAFSKKM